MGDAGAYAVSRLVTREMGMRIRPFKGERKKILISTKSVKTLIHLTFHRNFFIAVISESDCATIENLRSCQNLAQSDINP
ncbi:hypothetical protein ACVXG8_04650 [Escherichia coli]